MLTTAERRGAWLVAAVLVIGTAWDLYEARFARPRPFPHERAVPLQSADLGADTARGESGILDLNGASVAELQSLPGIGPVLAGRIVAYRAAHGPFRRSEELLAVRGIGPALYARLQGRLRVSTQP